MPTQYTTGPAPISPSDLSYGTNEGYMEELVQTRRHEPQGSEDSFTFLPPLRPSNLEIQVPPTPTPTPTSGASKYPNPPPSPSEASPQEDARATLSPIFPSNPCRRLPPSRRLSQRSTPDSLDFKIGREILERADLACICHECCCCCRERLAKLYGQPLGSPSASDDDEDEDSEEYGYFGAETYPADLTYTAEPAYPAQTYAVEQAYTAEETLAMQIFGVEDPYGFNFDPSSLPFPDPSDGEFPFPDVDPDSILCGRRPLYDVTSWERDDDSDVDMDTTLCCCACCWCVHAEALSESVETERSMPEDCLMSDY